MTPKERSKIKIEIINALPTGFLVKDLAEILREVATEIESYTDDDTEEEGEE